MRQGVLEYPGTLTDSNGLLRTKKERGNVNFLHEIPRSFVSQRAQWPAARYFFLAQESFKVTVRLKTLRSGVES